jgi:hypothetical protein
MRYWTLMVRRRFFSAVSNHEVRGLSFETRAKSALLRMRQHRLIPYCIANALMSTIDRALIAN